MSRCDGGDSWSELVADGAAPWKARAGLAGTRHEVPPLVGDFEPNHTEPRCQQDDG